jgi:hypothetical protein
MKPPGPALSLALLAVLAGMPAAVVAGCTLLLVEPACLVSCSAQVGAPVPARGASEEGGR